MAPRGHPRTPVLLGLTEPPGRVTRLIPKYHRQCPRSCGDGLVHESIIGSLFHGRVEAAANVGPHDAIVPSVAGWARITGLNTIFIHERDPYAHGFVVK